MTTKVALRQKPEEQELARKLSELRQLEGELSERELGLTNLSAELASFEGRYLRTVGTRYAELDEINALLAAELAKRLGTERARVAATKATERARGSYAAAHGESSEATEFVPSHQLKSLYREVAKRIHPDLAFGATDRNIREKLMAEANVAYRQNDEMQLKQILERYESSPESVVGEGVAAELVRTIRRITQVNVRLLAIEGEMRELMQSEIFGLRQRTLDLREFGRDLLAELASNVQMQIAEARSRLNKIGGTKHAG